MARVIQEGQANNVKVQLVGREEGDPEFYIDGIHGIQLTGPVIKLNLYTLAMDSTSESQRREAVCRLVMSTPQFVGMVDFLSQYVAKLREQAQKMREASGMPVPGSTEGNSGGAR